MRGMLRTGRLWRGLLGLGEARFGEQRHAKDGCDKARSGRLQFGSAGQGWVG